MLAQFYRALKYARSGKEDQRRAVFVVAYGL